MSERRALVVLLCAQAALLFAALDLLPAWGDEVFTLQTVARPVPEILRALRADVHPPLYYLMAHAWPWRGIVGLRALSALWTLAATAALAVFWRDRALRLANALFAFSPCLLLYGRMARSYAMETALAIVAVALVERWSWRPRSWGLAAGAFAASLALLYTHYVPGAAVLAGLLAAFWRPLGLRRAVAFAAALAVAYAPWAVMSLDALRRWGSQASYSSTYALSGSLAREHILKLGFGAVSLTIGESFLAASLLVVPLAWWLAFRGIRARPFPPVFGAVAAAIGYLGVSRWVSYPFIPARLLWLLPFLCLAMVAGIGGRRWLGALLLVSYGTSTALYFRRENFLNLGYIAPVRAIAAALNRDAGPRDVILLDGFNADYQAISAELSGRAPVIVLDGRRLLPVAATVWIVRNTHDASPGGLVSEMEAEACAGRPRRDTLLDPYAPWQQAVLRAAGSPLTHFYRMTACGDAVTQ